MVERIQMQAQFADQARYEAFAAASTRMTQEMFLHTSQYLQVHVLDRMDQTTKKKNRFMPHDVVEGIATWTPPDEYKPQFEVLDGFLLTLPLHSDEMSMAELKIPAERALRQSERVDHYHELTAHLIAAWKNDEGQWAIPAEERLALHLAARSMKAAFDKIKMKGGYSDQQLLQLVTDMIGYIQLELVLDSPVAQPQAHSGILYGLREEHAERAGLADPTNRISPVPETQMGQIILGRPNKTKR
jgi:hypothetical protein